eukprot:gene5936-6535_t
MALILTLAKWFTPDFFGLASRSNTLQVVTISFSHFTELAVWSLKAGHKTFVEHGYAPIFHILAALFVRVCDGRKYLCQTSRIIRMDEILDPEAAKKHDEERRSTVVPVGVLPNGEVLLDSWDITRYSGLAPISASLQDLLDEGLAPLLRLRFYYYVMKPLNWKTFDQMWTKHLNMFEYILWYLGLRYIAHDIMVDLFQANNRDVMIDSAKNATLMWNRVQEVVTSRSGAYLGGDVPGVADIAISSIAAFILFPPLFFEGRYERIFTEMLERDEEARKEVIYYRSTPLGQYVIDLYQQHRL